MVRRSSLPHLLPQSKAWERVAALWIDNPCRALNGRASRVEQPRRRSRPHCGSALHVMLFLKNLLRALWIFNGLRSRHCQRALLVYHYPETCFTKSTEEPGGHGGVWPVRVFLASIDLIRVKRLEPGASQ